MGKVTMNWLTTGHSGRACKQDAVYTKINKQTGQVTSSKLCNPFKGEASDLQMQQRSRFGAVSKACQDFLRKGKNDKNETYLTVVNAYKAQHKSGSMLGYMMQKIADPRPGMTEPEYRAIVKGWVTVSEGDSGQTPGGNGQTPPSTDQNDDDHGL